jgi:hypothetical protein
LIISLPRSGQTGWTDGQNAPAIRLNLQEKLFLPEAKDEVSRNRLSGTESRGRKQGLRSADYRKPWNPCVMAKPTTSRIQYFHFMSSMICVMAYE